LVKNQKVFPSDNAALKVIYLALEAAIKKMNHANKKLQTQTKYTDD
jgi:hypothetical protein